MAKGSGNTKSSYGSNPRNNEETMRIERDALSGVKTLSSEPIDADSETEELLEEWSYDYGMHSIRSYNEALDKFIEENPKYKGDTYRGIKLSESEVEKFKRAIVSGETISGNDKPYLTSSWSTSEETSNEYYASIVQPRHDNQEEKVVLVCKGYNNGVNIEKYNPDEHEVLVHSNTKYKVQKHYKKGDTNYFEVVLSK